MQNDYNTHIIRLQNEVNRVFGKVVTSVADFEQLAEQVPISLQTLRRFYGKIDKDKKLGTTSLNRICAYIGVPDWESFCKGAVVQNLDSHRIINAFYDTVAYSNASFFDARLRDTHEAYAEIILQDIPYAHTFLDRYRAYPKITQSLYPWFPYYDRMAQSDYIQLIESYLKTQPLDHLIVCQNSFLAYGAFCRLGMENGKKAVEKYTKEADKYIERVWKAYPDSFFHYPETRYTIAKVAQAYLNHNEQEAIRIAEAALERNLRAKPLYVFDEYFQTPDILVSKLCNALIWMGKIDFAIEIYSTYSQELFLSKDPVEQQSKTFVYERDTNFAAQTVDILRLFAPSIPILESKRQPHWKTKRYEQVQQSLIALKACPRTKLTQKRILKEHLLALAKELNYGVVEELIKIMTND
jgi:hypothetical protein